VDQCHYFLAIFIFGTPLYKRVPPKENIIVKFIAVILVTVDASVCSNSFGIRSVQYAMQFSVQRQNEENTGFIMRMINIA
jgi:hypothetical protein